jgi:hypothetical protein
MTCALATQTTAFRHHGAARRRTITHSQIGGSVAGTSR